jgi:hypothetical protein
MEEINELIGKLSPVEIKLVNTYLKSLVIRNKKDMKLQAFFDFLVKNKKEKPDAEACSLFLYDAAPDARFRMIKAKLKSRILDALVTDQNIERNDMLDAADLSAIRARKRLSQYYWLTLTRGHSAFSNMLLEEIIRNGLKYENYVAVTEALKAKKYQKGFSRGLRDFQKINEQIAFYEYCDQCKVKARDYYYKLILRSDFHTGSRNEHQRFLEECIVELVKDHKYTKSALVGYYLKLLEFAYYNITSDHEAARQSCLEMLDIVRDHESVYKKQRVGITFDYIAECDVNLGAYERALMNFRSAQKFFMPASSNYLVSKEAELKTLFYTGDMRAAERVLVDVVGEPGIHMAGEFRQSKYQYYLANILFAKGKYKEALRVISQHMEISKDKTGWEISVRVLAILCNMELERFDEAALQVENLRKHAERNRSEKTPISPRDSVIIRLLKAMAAKGFMFATLDKKTLDLAEQLAGADAKYRWQPFGPELIRFHDWIQGKLGFALKTTKEEEHKHSAEKQLVLAGKQ